MQNFFIFFLLGTAILSLLTGLLVVFSIYKISSKNRLLIYKNPFTPKLPIRKLALIYLFVIIALGIGFNFYFFFFL